MTYGRETQAKINAFIDMREHLTDKPPYTPFLERYPKVCRCMYCHEWGAVLPGDPEYRVLREIDAIDHGHRYDDEGQALGCWMHAECRQRSHGEEIVMGPSNEITARRTLQAFYHTLLAAGYALEAWDRVVGEDSREPIPAMQQELQACRTLDDMVGWARKWLGSDEN
jgi:hypothetical protein